VTIVTHFEHSRVQSDNSRHFEHLRAPRNPRGITRVRHDEGFRYNLLGELKMTTVSHLEHLIIAMCDVESTERQQLQTLSTRELKVTTIVHFEHLAAPRTPCEFTRAQHDRDLRSTFITELKVTTLTHLKHPRIGMCDGENSKRRQSPSFPL